MPKVGRAKKRDSGLPEVTLSIDDDEPPAAADGTTTTRVASSFDVEAPAVAAPSAASTSYLCQIIDTASSARFFYNPGITVPHRRC